MRAIVTILAIIVVIGILAVATGFVNLHSRPGSLPTVAVSGGSLPKVSADVGTIDVGTKNKMVDVPKVDVGSTRQQVSVPTVEVNKPQ